MLRCIGISNVRVWQPFSTSDHCSVAFNLSFIDSQLCNRTAPCTQYDFNDVDWSAVNDCLAIVDLSCVFSTCVCMDDFNIAFNAVIYGCISVFIKNVPHSASVGSRRNNKHNCPRFVKRLDSK